MSPRFPLFLRLLFLALAATIPALPGPVPAAPATGGDGAVRFAQDLALSPDGTTLLFAWAGDLWSADARGGAARRLTTHPAWDGGAVWSPDGTRVAFATGRHGSSDIYVMESDGTALRRLSWLDHAEGVGGWFPDEKGLLVIRNEGASVDRDWAFTVQPLDGATPRLLTSLRGRGARPSPDGRRIVFEQGNGSWDRKGYVGAASRDLFVWEIGAPAARRLTATPGNDGRAQWAGDQHLFFLSERSGVANVWTMPAEIGESAARQLTFHGDDMVREFAVAADGRVLVYAVWDTVYRAEAPDFRPEPIVLETPSDRPYLGALSEVRTSGADEMAPSPSGEELAVVVRGDIFLVPTAENRPTRAVTRTAARDRMVAWSSDGRELFFVSDREEGVEQLYRARPVFAPKEEDDEDEEAEEAEDAATDEVATEEGVATPASGAPAGAEPSGTGEPPTAPVAAGEPVATSPASGPAEPGAAAADPAAAPEEVEAGQPAGAATPEPAPRSVEELRADVALADTRLAALGERMAALELERAAAGATITALERDGIAAGALHASTEGRVLRDRRNELLVERELKTARGEDAAALEAAVAAIERQLARLVGELIAAERGHLATVEQEHASLAALHAETVGARARALALLTPSEATPPTQPAEPAGTGGAAAPPRPEAAKEEPIELEDRPLWRAIDFEVERLTRSGVAEFRPSPSPDGTRLAFVRGLGTLVVRHLATGGETVLFEHWDEPSFAWSPDGRWIACARDDHEFNRDVWILAADGSGEPYNVSRHPDWDGNPSWSSDGKVLAFASRRRGDEADIYFVYTDRALEEATPLALEEYYEKAAEGHKERLKALREKLTERRREAAKAARAAAIAAPADPPVTGGEPQAAAAPEADASATGGDADAKVPPQAKEGRDAKGGKAKDFRIEIDFDRLYERLHRVTSFPEDQTNYVMAPDGATFLVERDGELVSVRWNGRDVKETGVEVAGGLVPSFDGSRVFFLAAGGRPAGATMSGGDRKSYGMSARQAIDLDAERAQKFDDAARTLGRAFYHPTMKGLDWTALSARYRDLALATTTRDEFNAVVNYLFGELNASHLGIWGGEPAPPSGNESTGRLGVDLDPAWEGEGLRVAAVVRDSPAARKESAIRPGDVLLAIEGRPLGRDANLHRELLDRVGEPVRLTVAPSDDLATTRTVTLEPTSTDRLEELRYEQWVAERRELVDAWSGGRLGYAHVRGMSMPSVEQLERDLYAVGHGKEGLVLDVRFNGGGWTADILLTILDTRQHAQTLARGASIPGYPQDRRLVYQWSRPAILLCNEKSFSNAEIFAHAWKTLGRGLLVGMPTAGGVISTGGTSLIDGTVIRLPFRGWFLAGDGRDMENNGAVPDLVVPHTPDDMLRGADPQLRRAVEALVGQLDGAAAGAAGATPFTPLYDATAPR